MKRYNIKRYREVTKQSQRETGKLRGTETNSTIGQRDRGRSRQREK
jgi:hypothetical protein